MSVESMLKEVATLLPMRDVAVNAVGGFLGGLCLLWVTLGFGGIRSLRSRFGRATLSITRRETPDNIFAAMEPGAPASWVQQQLGAPTRVWGRAWGYRFTDSMVVIRFTESDSLESVAVALTNPKAHFDFPAIHFDCPPLGRMTLKDLLGADHLSMSFNQSLRHSEIVMAGREGPPGAWHYVAFGALAPHVGGCLLPTDFSWDAAAETYKGRPEDIKINWASVSTTSEIEGFPWDFGLPFWTTG